MLPLFAFLRMTAEPIPFLPICGSGSSRILVLPLPPSASTSLLSSPLRCSARIRSWPCSFSLFINDLPASLFSSVSCSLYADDLAISFSSLFSPTAVEATQGALIWLARWSEYWCLSFNLSKCEASFSVDLTKLTSNPTSSYSTPASVSIPLQHFLGSALTALFPFLNMYLHWMSSSPHVSRPYAVSLLPHGGPPKGSLSPV